MLELVVTQSFANRAKGDVITDPDEMKAAREGSPHCVVARAKQEPPVAQPAPVPVAPKPAV
jgi:hypothetical protein